ncbi:IS1634 family transposase [Metallibacterium scheffleri]|uniref:IS1634 family transposase n=2 Tax=Metallibacterium scheffleri TaxID=993689 RepID=A0A4S3KCE6_9GAMM|nr:IS1634 family transposase [Metallibacterium scheffleri]THD06102.1 IS1634 family transposase [Metallibacterium scheffleri]
MYTRISRSGGRSYLQLVEGYRTDTGTVRQRIVATLGRLDQLEPKHLDPLIQGLHRALGRAEPTAAPVTYESARTYGDVYALHALWTELGFADAVRAALRSSRRSFDAEALVRAMVFNRLCAPDSKLGCLDWLQTVAIPGMPEEVTHDQLLRTMDALMDRAEAVEARIARQLHPLLDQQLSVVFYDLTTVRIHGAAELPGDVRAFGLNKETGGIARQFVLGVVQSAEGLPLMHTVHAGNVAETKTLKAMLEAVLQRFAVERVIVVADRGLLSLDNVAELTQVAESTQRQLQFILAVPARRYGELGGTLAALDFQDGLAEGTFAGHRLVVAHDPVRAAEQAAKRRARIQELEAFAQTLVRKLDAQDEGQSARGRKASDRGAYSRFARAVAEAELTRFVQADYQAERFSYHLDEEAIAWAERFDGKLVLLSNVSDFSAAEILARYKSLADIERGFRVLKSDLEIAPVYHRLPERIRAHALICFLALVLYRVMRMRLKASGSTTSPKTALEILRRIQQHHVAIGDHAYRGVSKTTPEQLALFDALTLPKL